jgi:hypothetical protein
VAEVDQGLRAEDLDVMLRTLLDLGGTGWTRMAADTATRAGAVAGTQA